MGFNSGFKGLILGPGRNYIEMTRL